MLSHRRMDFWDVVMNKGGDPTPEAPPVTPVACHTCSLPRLLPQAADEVKKISSAPKQDESCSRASSTSATSTFAPSDGGHRQKASAGGSSERMERISAIGLGERRAQRSGHGCKPHLLLSPIFRHVHQDSTRNIELIRRLLTSDAPS